MEMQGRMASAKRGETTPMQRGTTRNEVGEQLEVNLDADPLAYLPRRPVQVFSRNRTIYGTGRSSQGLYVVIVGRVQISWNEGAGIPIIVTIVSTDGFFGESCLVGTNSEHETAVALDEVSLMAWTRREVEDCIDREPRLGLALSKYMMRKCFQLENRIESMTVLKTPERLLLALAQLATELGTRQPDGTVRIKGLTHHTLAGYVGTSREMVTSQMNHLRRCGLLQYTRKHIDIDAQGFQEELRERGVKCPHGFR